MESRYIPIALGLLIKKKQAQLPKIASIISTLAQSLTVAAAMQLVEQGQLGLDDPVCRYLPEYTDAYYMEDGKPVTVGETMTVWHLFTMSAGVIA